MKKHLMVFRIRFINNMQYRAAAVAGIATQFVWAIMGILAYDAFYKSDPSFIPMEFSQLVTYLWMQQAFLPFFAMWFLDGKIFTAIQTGAVAYELVRPISLYNYWYSQSLGNRLSHGVLRCMPVLIIAFFLPHPFRMSLPLSSVHFLLFLVSAVLSVNVVVAFSMLIYVTTFYTVSGSGIKIVISTLSDFLAGSVIPLTFFPNNIRIGISMLPFASMMNMPLRIYSGNISNTEAYFGILLQTFWMIVLILLGKYTMKRALNKVIVQGG